MLVNNWNCYVVDAHHHVVPNIERREKLVDRVMQSFILCTTDEGPRPEMFCHKFDTLCYVQHNAPLTPCCGFVGMPLIK